MCVIYRTPSSSGSCSTNACRASNSSSVARASAAHEQQIATASWPKAVGNVISMAEWDRAGPRMSGKLNSCAELVQVGCWTLEQRDLGVTVTTYVRATCGTWLAHSRLVALHTDHHHRSPVSLSPPLPSSPWLPRLPTSECVASRRALAPRSMWLTSSSAAQQGVCRHAEGASSVRLGGPGREEHPDLYVVHFTAYATCLTSPVSGNYIIVSVVGVSSC